MSESSRYALEPLEPRTFLSASHAEVAWEELGTRANGRGPAPAIRLDLVALSEHIAFHWAYLVASVACIGLIGFYLSAVLRSAARGLGFAAMLATLYAALYGLLVSEDNALVLGSGLLFVILAALMAATRKVDWYQVGGALRPQAQAV